MKKSVTKILLSFLLVAVVLVGGTLAYLFATDSPLLNTFALAEVETEIVEPEGDKAPKVHNKGESPVYVRARVAITDLPEGVTVYPDYNGNSEGTSGDWQYCEEDGFWYYMSILQPDETTTKVFTIDPANDIQTASTVDKDVPMNFSVDVYQESVLAPADGTWSLTAAQAAFNKKG